MILNILSSCQSMRNTALILDERWLSVFLCGGARGGVPGVTGNLVLEVVLVLAVSSVTAATGTPSSQPSPGAPSCAQLHSPSIVPTPSPGHLDRAFLFPPCSPSCGLWVLAPWGTSQRVACREERDPRARNWTEVLLVCPKFLKCTFSVLVNLH